MNKTIKYITLFFLLVISSGVIYAQTKTYRTTNRNYELANHQSNVLETVSDKLVFTNVGLVASTTSYSDYFPYGMQMMGRNESTPSYRYGFQGQEKDDEVKGQGNSVNYKYRMHDVRLGRFFAQDPLSDIYPHNSTYAFSENRLIDGSDLEGAEFDFRTTTISGGVKLNIVKGGLTFNSANLNWTYDMKVKEKDSPFGHQYGMKNKFTKKDGMSTEFFYKYADNTNGTSITGNIKLTESKIALGATGKIESKNKKGDVEFKDGVSTSLVAEFKYNKKSSSYSFGKLNFESKLTGDFATKNSFENIDPAQPLPLTTQTNNAFGNLTGKLNYSLIQPKIGGLENKLSITGSGKLGFKSIYDDKGANYSFKLQINSFADDFGFFYDIKSKLSADDKGGIGVKASETGGDKQESKNSGSVRVP